MAHQFISKICNTCSFFWLYIYIYISVWWQEEKCSAKETETEDKMNSKVVEEEEEKHCKIEEGDKRL